MSITLVSSRGCPHCGCDRFLTQWWSLLPLRERWSSSTSTLSLFRETPSASQSSWWWRLLPATSLECSVPSLAILPIPSSPSSIQTRAAQLGRQQKTWAWSVRLSECLHTSMPCRLQPLYCDMMLMAQWAWSVSIVGGIGAWQGRVVLVEGLVGGKTNVVYL